jgi:hypothetical protein
MEFVGWVGHNPRPAVGHPSEHHIATRRMTWAVITQSVAHQLKSYGLLSAYPRRCRCGRRQQSGSSSRLFLCVLSGSVRRCPSTTGTSTSCPSTHYCLCRLLQKISP